jgi:hypothetical protein
VLLYHYTKQQVWELLETTLLAMICSFHMMSSRSEHWNREEELEGLIGLEIVANHDSDTKHNNCKRSPTADQHRSLVDGEERSVESSKSFDTDRNMEADDNQSYSKHFFEHFLDGAAGVMYTSFLGLIIDEFIVWGMSSRNNA